MRIWLEIQRTAGIDHRDIKPENDIGIADGACPGCNAEPFLVQGQGAERYTADTLRANGIAKCCGDPVGFIYAERDTIFGEEEDQNVTTFARARVYGGQVRP